MRSQVRVDNRRAGVGAHAGRADDVSGALGLFSMPDPGDAQSAQDVLVNGSRRGKSILDVFVQPKVHTWPRDAEAVRCAIIEDDAIIGVGKLLDESSQSHMPRGMVTQLRIQRSAPQPLLCEFRRSGNRGPGRPGPAIVADFNAERAAAISPGPGPQVLYSRGR